MDDLLDQNWQDGRRPFDGDVIVSKPELTPEQLALALGQIVHTLRTTFGSEELGVNQDWHDHDGIVTPVKPCSWDELATWTASIDSLVESCSDDWMVHTLVFSQSLAFCLRYWIDLEDSNDPAAYCDLSAGDSTLDQVEAALATNSLNVFEREVAKEFFAGRAGR